jgi:two-component system, OmpR family, response regulator MprA
MRVLTADDDAAVRDALRRVLEHEGYDVELASRGDEALTRALAGGLDLIVLDVLMPEPDGLQVCRTLRGRDVQTPILMLTARGEVADRVAGLDAGADDYLAKPFELDELLARIRALLRRSRNGGKTLRFGDLSLDTDSRKVLRGTREIELTRTEHALLELFLANAGKVLSRTEIFEAVWGYDFGPLSNSLEVYVGYLRRKTEAAGEPRLLHTVRGFGYVLREEP